ncbi:lactate utilization protein [Ciceribacter sp. RN22]|uniref:LutC/YkgG family protein n=1 Tax=Ciceribacter sp. RN22 TaxID=2954932 RepID=UPI0020928D55|nr:lactate utilization protein [Ciceribacter sp. RN22]MCO6177196.1 lactate utilization protein [Ciceribacter sp. RN22]
MDGKSAILKKVRASLKASPDDSARRSAVASRLAETPRGIIPARGQLPGAARLDLFVAMAEKYNASTTRIAALSALPAAVADYLKGRNLPASVRIGNDPRLAVAPWGEERTLEIRHGASDGHDLAAISHAFGAIAETGTLALLSGPDNPVTLTFLPEHHIVALDARDIAGDMEAVWSRLRAVNGKAAMPRTVNFVTGPSRSADIEQTLLLGAHGPRALHIVIVGEPSA